MFKDKFVRLCLVVIVLLIGLIACRLTPPETVEAAASDCLIEPSGPKDPTDRTDYQQITTQCKQRMAEGWRLQSFGMGAFVWVK